MTTVYIGVGSNIEPLDNITAALDLLRDGGTGIVASSRFYRTAAIGRPEQEAYANGVWRARCGLPPRELRTVLRRIERQLGRIRTEDKFAPRSIDLDILLFGELLIEDAELRVPDPHILERPFLSKCLLELDPDIRMPDSGFRLAELARADWTTLEEYSEITQTIRQKLESEG